MDRHARVPGQHGDDGGAGSAEDGPVREDGVRAEQADGGAAAAGQGGERGGQAGQGDERDGDGGAQRGERAGEGAALVEGARVDGEDVEALAVAAARVREAVLDGRGVGEGEDRGRVLVLVTVLELLPIRRPADVRGCRLGDDLVGDGEALADEGVDLAGEVGFGGVVGEGGVERGDCVLEPADGGGLGGGEGARVGLEVGELRGECRGGEVTREGRGRGGGVGFDELGAVLSVWAVFGLDGTTYGFEGQEGGCAAGVAAADEVVAYLQGEGLHDGVDGGRGIVEGRAVRRLVVKV